MIFSTCIANREETHRLSAFSIPLIVHTSYTSYSLLCALHQTYKHIRTRTRGLGCGCTNMYPHVHRTRAERTEEQPAAEIPCVFISVKKKKKWKIICNSLSEPIGNGDTDGKQCVCVGWRYCCWRWWRPWRLWSCHCFRCCNVCTLYSHEKQHSIKYKNLYVIFRDDIKIFSFILWNIWI